MEKNYFKTVMLFSCLSFFCSNKSVAQINGIKTIGVDYASVQAAIAALNNGATGGTTTGVVINVPAGWTETFSSPTGGLINITVNKPSSTATIVFQKSGVGANPIITSGIGTMTPLTTPVATSPGDGIIVLQGTDYITFDGIDLFDPTTHTTQVTQMEFGYALLKASNNDGCQNVIIKNCTITLQKAYSPSTTVYSYGIYANHHTPSSITALAAPTLVAGANSNNQFYSNTITNANMGIFMTGYADATPFTYHDQSNLIGVAGGNTITNYGGTSGLDYGIGIFNSRSTQILNNSIINGSQTNSGLYGIFVSGAGNVIDIGNNSINGLLITAGTPLTGINVVSGTTINIYKNKIYDLTNNRAAANTVLNGISTTAGITINISNNTIGDLKTPFNTNPNGLFGLNLVGVATNNISVYYNSIYLNTTGGVNFGASGIFTSVLPNIILKNNLVVNLSTANGTGYACAHRRSATGILGTLTADNNLYCVNACGYSKDVIYYDAATSYQSITSYKALVAPKEASSVTDNPTFLSTSGASANFLHIDGSIQSLAESGGVAIASYIDDIDGAGTRPALGYPLGGQTHGGGTTPDIGADEYDGTPGINMVYSSSTVYQVVGTVIQGSINQQVIRIEVSANYSKNPLAVTQFVVNANGTTSIADINGSTAKIYYTGTSSTFTTTTLFGSAVPTIANFNVAGSQVLEPFCTNYFWLAYDIAAGAAACNVVDGECVGITAGGSFVPSVTAPAYYRIVKTAATCLSGAYTINNTLPPSCTNYTDFTSAVNDLNTFTICGPVVYTVSAGQTFNESNLLITRTGTVANTITFQEAGGVNPIILAAPGTGASDGIIKLQGVDYITFDGIDVKESPVNISSSTQMEWGYALFANSATDGSQNVTIKNSTVTLNKSNTATKGIYLDANRNAAGGAITPTNATGANSNFKFYNNTVTNTIYGIYLNGAAAPYYDQSVEIGVSGANTISNYAGNLQSCAAIYVSNQNSLKIANNIITNSSNSQAHLYGVNMFGCVGSTIDIYNNTFSNLTSTSGVLYLINTNTDALSTATLNIYNNTFTGLDNTSGSALNCIMFGISTLNPNTIRVYNNTFSNMNVTNVFQFYFVFIPTIANNLVEIYNNTLSNITSPTSFNGIGCSANAGNTTCDINIYNNNINTITLTTGSFTGIEVGSGRNHTVYSNTIHDITAVAGSVIAFREGNPFTRIDIYSNNFYNLTANTNGTVRGIDSQVDAVRTVYQNNIYNLTTATGAVQGIYCYGNITASYDIYKNKLYSYIANGTTSTVEGISFGSAGNNSQTAFTSIYNNMISDLRAPNSTSATAILGMNFASQRLKIYYNSIYINATSSSATTFGTAGIYALAASPLVNIDLRNNLIVNTSTPGPTAGKTVAYQRSANSLANFDAASNYNLYYAGSPSANQLIFYDGTNAIQTIAAYKTFVSAREANAVTGDPAFLTATDLHGANATNGIVFDNLGTPIATTDDLDGDVRSVTAPDIGFDEFTISLPIELLNFSGEDQGKTNLLHWTTSSEINNDYFTLERSADANIFEPIGIIDGSGNSSTSHYYSFVDQDPYQVTYYRLKQTDFNGDSSYSQIIVITKKAGIEIISIYPNPVSSHFQYIVSSSDDTQVNISVIDVLGRTVISQPAISLVKGINYLSLDIAILSKGSYFLQVKTMSGIYSTQKKLVTE